MRTVLELLVAAAGLRLLAEGGRRLRQEPPAVPGQARGCGRPTTGEPAPRGGGHLRVAELEPRLLEAYAVLIKSDLPGAAAIWTCEALIAVIAHAQPGAEEAARFALRAGLA